ncbi:hypothetical protein PUN28_011275 [Cardiocondyla obscurior]
MYPSRDIEKIIRNIIYALKNKVKCDLYNVKIFDANGNIDVVEFIPLCDYAKCYNGFLLNTNFSSHYLLNKQIFGSVGSWPLLSPYFFIQIIWFLKCEDLLIESLVHVPLDLCIEILELTIKHINELEISRARRIILLLIYKVYNKCLWLHLGTLSEENVMRRIYQLVTYFKKLCDMLVSQEYVIDDISLRKYLILRGILMKNMLRYVRKCMHSKMESYSEHQSLAKLFTLTYGSFDECSKYYHIISINEIKSIVMKLDEYLVTLLLQLIKDVDQSELMTWKTSNDDENTMISLRRGIATECHYFLKFIRHNEFLVKNKHLFYYLEQFASLRNSRKFTFTLKELCRDITHGNRYGMQELIKRYKEWDLSTLDFIMKRKQLLNIDNYYTILKYLHHICAHTYSKVEKYRVYIAVFKILIQLKVYDLYFITLKYVHKHFDDKHLEDFYDGTCFDAYLQQSSFPAKTNLRHITTVEQPSYGILLIFILLNPKRALSQLILYEINVEDTKSIIFQKSMLASIVQNYYKSGHRNILTYVLQDILLQQRVTFNLKFRTFIDKVRTYKMMTANDLMNYLYIPYLHGSHLNVFSLHNMLLHITYFLEEKHCSLKTNFLALIPALTKTASLMRRCNRGFSKFTLHVRIQLISDIISQLYAMRMLSVDQISTLSTHGLWDRVEPLDMKMLLPMMTTFDILQIYAKRCFITHQRLRTNPRCHPKLRNYVQSFHLDQEAFIRYIMLHCFDRECADHARDLTFICWYNFGWINHMMAYENTMRIIVDVAEIILKYSNAFPRHTFIILLFALVRFCNYVKQKLIPEYSFDTIRNIMLDTMSSMKHMVSRTHYAEFYVTLLQEVHAVSPQLRGKKYFRRIWHLIDMYTDIYSSEATPTPILKTDCTCAESSYCKFYAFVIDEKITANYQTYLFIRECINHARTHNYSERLLRALCLTE